MRSLGMVLFLLVGLIAGPRSADAHAAPCPEHRATAAETVAVTAAQEVEALLVAVPEGDLRACGSAQMDCHEADCCQAVPAADLASVTADGSAFRAVPDTGPVASPPWTEPTRRVFRPPARG